MIEYETFQNSKKALIKLFDKCSKGERTTSGDSFTTDLKHRYYLLKLKCS